MNVLLHKIWTLGYKDRGLGNGDWAVMTDDDLLIVECPCKDIAEHIIKLHNEIGVLWEPIGKESHALTVKDVNEKV
jgi:hypothetical protein